MTAQHTSLAAYKALQNDIARLIDVLQKEVQQHGEEASTKEKCWGEVGDLGKVRSDLINLVGFLSGMNRQEIESFLSE